MDLDIALHKLNQNFYYRHNGTYASLEMLDNSLKPSLESLHTAYLAWLNGEAKTNALALLESRAEAERLKYITAGDGKAMAYQQQLFEVRRWESGETNAAMFPVANQLSVKLGVPVFAVLAQWQQNINAWLVIGGKIEANLAKAKADLNGLSFDNLQALDNFVAGVNFYL